MKLALFKSVAHPLMSIKSSVPSKLIALIFAGNELAIVLLTEKLFDNVDISVAGALYPPAINREFTPSHNTRTHSPVLNMAFVAIFELPTVHVFPVESVE